LSDELSDSSGKVLTKSNRSLSSCFCRSSYRTVDDATEGLCGAGGLLLVPNRYDKKPPPLGCALAPPSRLLDVAVAALLLVTTGAVLDGAGVALPLVTIGAALDIGELSGPKLGGFGAGVSGCLLP
jgi:hypothetical protein